MASELKPLDRLFQRWRLAKSKPYVPRGARVLDIGCADGELFQRWEGHISGGVGIDPNLGQPVEGNGYRLLPGRFPSEEPLEIEGKFDVIAMLAVLEHLADAERAHLGDECAGLLKPGGRVVITVPSPRVDDILHVLLRLRLVAGQSVHEHHGFQPSNAIAVFQPPKFKLLARRTFQLGLNNLFVFESRA
jgi:SAM-dependent methyltransferase